MTKEIRFTNQTFDKENPVQVKYLRDVIKKYYDEETRAVGEVLPSGATLPSTDAEKRLQNVLAALVGLARQAEARQGHSDGWWSGELRKLLEENT